MLLHQIATSGPGDKGLWPVELIVKATFTEAASRYDVVQFDFMDVAANGAIAPGNDTQFSTVRSPDTGTAPDIGLEQGIFGVAMEDVAAAGEGRVMVTGITLVNSNASTVKGDASTAATDGELDLIVGTTGFKVIAIALEDHGDTSTNETTCWFNGFGFGQDG